MISFIKEKSKNIFHKIYKQIHIVLTVALSIIETLILMSINNHLKIYNENIDLYLVAIPILFIVLINWTRRKNIFAIEKQDNRYQEKLIFFKNSFILTIFIYLITILTNINITNKSLKISIILICFGAIYSSFVCLKKNTDENMDENLNIKNQEENKLFNTYYINISKVFEIAMLINNKIAISINNEKIIEKNESINENLSRNINIDYLNSIKNGVSFQDAYTKSNSTKSKVLENFEVKTTKSNLLENIIKKAKEYKPEAEINAGDLLIFNDVKIELKNGRETMEMTRMLVNGAFNGANVSSTTNDMKMDLNMSSLINSMLKDCSYELKCLANGLEFYVKIPMSFENDFESNYNIYDILIGKMTLIGIYRGKDNEKKYKNALDFFGEKQNAGSPLANSGLKKSAIYKACIINDEVAIEGENINYIDIIAIIKEINIDIK